MIAARKQITSLLTAWSWCIKAKQLLSNDVKLNCEAHLKSLTVKSKFSDSAKLETMCKIWNRLKADFHPWQPCKLLLTLLPTEVNLTQWWIQSDVRCTLCSSLRPTTIHILVACSVALPQLGYAYRHDRALHLLALRLLACLSAIHMPMSMLTYLALGQAKVPKWQCHLTCWSPLTGQILLFTFQRHCV